MTKEKKKKIIPLPRLSPGAALIDTHCHLDMEDYELDLDEVIKRATAAGVERIITVGIDLQSSRAAVELARRFTGIYATIGVHPHNVTELTGDDYDALRRLARQDKVVAYGEIGIDCVKDYAPLALQQKHFKKQVELALELDLPLVIHDREAHAEVLAILRAAGPFPAGGVMHCFSGDSELAQAVLDLGFMISIPGVVTFNKAQMMQDAVQAVPLTSLLLETDGPYLSPVPKRGKRNEPESMLYTAQKVAELKNVSLDEVARQTTANAVQLFNLRD
ncbi:MAG: TatD family hydrolase [Desulfobulbaceae bacterium]|nr:TatD family hydrolase [Desulfobulbaceae bacterium]